VVFKKTAEQKVRTQRQRGDDMVCRMRTPMIGHHFLREAADQNVKGLWHAIVRVVDLIRPDESANLSTAAGYGPE
jgi:hypothetical protein